MQKERIFWDKKYNKELHVQMYVKAASDTTLLSETHSYLHSQSVLLILDGHFL